jgi:hypothetical protein
MKNHEPLPNRREILAATVSAALLTAELQDSLARETSAEPFRATAVTIHFVAWR